MGSFRLGTLAGSGEYIVIRRQCLAGQNEAQGIQEPGVGWPQTSPPGPTLLFKLMTTLLPSHCGWWGRLREIIEVVICRHKMLCKYLAKRAGVQPEMDCGRGGRWNIHMQATKFLWVLSLCQCPCAPSPESCTYVHDPPLTIWSLVSVSLKELLH